MQDKRHIWAVMVLVAMGTVAGCGEDGDTDGTGKTGGGPAGQKAAPKVKLVKLDLSSVGMPLTIDAPEGATAMKEETAGIIRVQHSANFELNINANAVNIAERRKKAVEDEIFKLKQFFVDEADTLFYETDMYGSRQFRFVTNVKVAGKSYTISQHVPRDTKASIELMLQCARSLAAKTAAP